MIRAALIAYLAADETVGPLVMGKDDRGAAAPRIYSRAPEAKRSNTLGLLPRIEVMLVSSRWPRSQQGIVGDKYARLQLNCQAANSQQAIALAQAVRNATGDGDVPLHSFKGNMDTFDVRAAWFEDQRTEDLPPEHAGEATLFAEQLDLMIVYTEPN